MLFFRTVPPAITLVRWVNENAFVSEVQTRPCPTFGRPVHLGFPHRLRPGTSPQALRIPSRDGHPALRSTDMRWLQVGLGCVQLSPSCPFRRLHTFRFLRPARLRTPLLGYGAPHLSARGTSPLLNNALLGARFPLADHPGAIAWWLESKGWVQPLLRLFTRPWDKGLHFKSTGVFTGPFADWCLTQEAEVRSRRCCGNRRATGHRVKVSALR